MRYLICIMLLVGCAGSRANDGSFDPTFGVQGREAFPLSSTDNDQILAAIPLADGRLLIGAKCALLGCLGRLKPDGSFDTTFGPEGLGYVEIAVFSDAAARAHVEDVAILPDGRIAIVSLMLNVPTVFVLLPDGSALDPSVGSGTGYVTNVFGSYGVPVCGCRIAVQSDGKIIVGTSVSVNNVGTVLAAARLNSDITGLDPTFGTAGVQTVAFGLEGAGAGDDDVFEALAIQPDGKIILAGEGKLTNGTKKLEFARLLATGQRDTSFGPNQDGRFAYTDAAGNSRSIANITLDSVQRIVFVGQVAVGADFEAMVGRVTKSGAPDLSFAGTGFYEFQPLNTSGNNLAYSVAVTADSIFAGSQIPQTSGASVYYFSVTRLSSSGVPAATFGSAGTSYASFSVDSTSDSFPNVMVTRAGVVIAGSAQIKGTGLQIGVGRMKYEHIFGDAFQ